jgi:anti-sigma factor RsiW
VSPHPLLTCKELFDFLDDYVDGSLPAPQRDEFERHLRLCPACVNYLDGYRKTIALEKASCADGEPARAPQALLDAVRAAVRKAMNL